MKSKGGRRQQKPILLLICLGSLALFLTIVFSQANLQEKQQNAKKRLIQEAVEEVMKK